MRLSLSLRLRLQVRVGERHGALLEHSDADQSLQVPRSGLAMLLVTVPTLAVLLPAIVLVGVTLLITAGLEWILFAALWVGRAVKRLFGKQPTKDLNVPNISWKL